MRSLSPRLRLYLAVGLLTLFAAASSGITLRLWQQQVGFFHRDEALADDEQAFAKLAPYVAAERALGYLSDETSSPRKYLSAQYFLTPHVLVNLDTRYLEDIPQSAHQTAPPYRLIIGHFQNPEALAAILSARRLRILAQITEQLFILEAQ
jgi:hypothetical protein